MLAGAGIEVVKIPPRSPRAKRSCRKMGTDSTVRGHRSDANSRTRHLHAVLDEYVAHYNQHRPHRAMDLGPPDGSDTPVADLATTRIRRRKVLGGLIHEYERVA